jgi:hypothetical protein
MYHSFLETAYTSRYDHWRVPRLPTSVTTGSGMVTAKSGMAAAHYRPDQVGPPWCHTHSICAGSNGR